MNIKILISYNYNFPILNSDIIFPIQTGVLLKHKRLETIFFDNDGTNISKLNDSFCELTAQYWVWKNQYRLSNPDYIGFMHCRRHFCFDDSMHISNKTWLPKSCVNYIPFISKNYINYFNSASIYNMIKDSDCICLKKYDVSNLLGSKNNREHFSKIKTQKIEYFDELIFSIKRLYPDFSNILEKFLNSKYQYLCNMFIMRKELFEKYSEFCFNVLFYTRKELKRKFPNDSFFRTFGYLGEIVLSIFIFYLYDTNNYVVKEVNGVFVLSKKAYTYSRCKSYLLWICCKLFKGNIKRFFEKKRLLYVVYKSAWLKK